MRLLITRPQPDARILAARLEAEGHDCLIAPLLSIIPLTPELPHWNENTGLAFTSRNAIRALLAQFGGILPHILAKMPVFTIGAQSHAEAVGAGFINIQTSPDAENSNVAQFAQTIIAHKIDYKIFHLCGVHRAGDLCGLLHAQNIQAEAIVLYEAQAASHLPPALEKLDGVVLYSRRSAQIFIALMAAFNPLPRGKKFIAFCLTPEIAAWMRSQNYTAHAPPQDALYGDDAMCRLILDFA